MGLLSTTTLDTFDARLWLREHHALIKTNGKRFLCRAIDEEEARKQFWRMGNDIEMWIPKLDRKTIYMPEPQAEMNLRIEHHFPKFMKLDRRTAMLGEIDFMVEGDVCDLRNLPSTFNYLVLVGEFSKIVCTDNRVRNIKRLIIQSDYLEQIDLPCIKKIESMWIRGREEGVDFNFTTKGVTELTYIKNASEDEYNTELALGKISHFGLDGEKQIVWK